MVLTATPRDLAGTHPVPPGRGRWRFSIHQRDFIAGGYGSATLNWQTSLLAILDHARGRRLERKWNTSAAVTFTVDGRDDVAALIEELQVDVYCWRWMTSLALTCACFVGLS